MNSLTFNFVVSWFVVKSKLVCLNMYSFPANWTKNKYYYIVHQYYVHRLHWIISLTTCLNTTDGMIFIFKLQSTIRPVLLYKSTRKLSNLYVHVQHNVNSVSITWSGVASCTNVCCLTLDIDIPLIVLLICLYKHGQTITLHPRLFNVYMFTYTWPR